MPAATQTDMSLGLQTVRDIPDPISLPVTGTLPLYLGTSTLYRTGPGRYDVTHKDGKPYHVGHWFDGLSLLHAFKIDARANEVRYRSRFLTDGLVRTVESVPRGRWNKFSFGPADPCRWVLGRLFQLWSAQPVDPATGEMASPNVGVTVQYIPGKGLVTRTDTSNTVAFDEETLEVEQFFGLEKAFPVGKGGMSAAHGQYDTATGEYVNYMYQLGGPGAAEHTVFSVKPDGTAEVLGRVWDRPCYLHSFAMTENYVVMIFWPLRIDGLQVVLHRSVMKGMQFEAGSRTRFAVVARDGSGLVAEYEAEAFFCFHTVNAYEEDGGIVIDVSRYDDDEIVRSFELEKMRSLQSGLPGSTLTRYCLPDVAGARASFDPLATSQKVPAAERQTLSPHNMELARISPKLMRRAHRFVYGVSSEEGADAAAFSRIAKVDVSSGERVMWGSGRVVVGEPIFVPDPEGVEEDDGSLLVVVLDAEVKRSKMVVLDARTMQETASAEVPQVVPLGFHGMYRPVEGDEEVECM